MYRGFPVHVYLEPIRNVPEYPSTDRFDLKRFKEKHDYNTLLNILTQ